ncbi:S-methyl-5'-thioadenosine phosphorylase [Acidobacteria bacterium AH-259-D05]|nr:S-methyl-5'-thioadenosine phosphorylase [Acidobacteria bacterium AH-259-D05]
MSEAEIGVIGGSGLYEVPELKDRSELQIDTPFGNPSEVYVVGTMGGKRVAFLARHGRSHRILPGELNFRANIYGFKKLGVRRILSASAVGSLKLEHKPMDFVLPDQFVDRTRGRVSTFFGEGVVAHISFADPICSQLADQVETAAGNIDLPIKRGGTYLCMEGPAFSTRAESHLYRSWGMDLIGMTNLQEAQLAREAEICYVTIAMVTDYDCWHEEEEPVTVETLINYLAKNSQNAQRLILEILQVLPEAFACTCQHALENAILTPADSISEETREKLKLVIGRYL